MKGGTIKKLRRIRNAYCYANFYMNRGLTIINTPYVIIKYTAFAGILVELINKAFGTSISLKTTLLLTIPLVIVSYIIGLSDAKKIHLLQKDNEISTTFNPVFDKMNKRIKSISKNTRQRVRVY